MFRIFSAISLLILFAVQSFDRVIIIVDYYANKATFISKCENKAKPQMNCNGSCVLMKKMLAEQNDNQKYPDLKLESKNDVFFADDMFLENKLPLFRKVAHYTIISSGKVVDRPQNVFRPPAGIADLS